MRWSTLLTAMLAVLIEGVAAMTTMRRDGYRMQRPVDELGER